MRRNVLSLQDLGFSFTFEGRELPALAGVDLAIGRNEFVAVVGPSGCGKSTLLRAINGLIPVTRGEIEWDTPEGAVDGRLRSALVFQAARLLPWRTVAQNVAFGLKGLPVPRREALERSLELLSVVGLREFADAYPRQLSGGMQQRVNLARALVVDPDLILLDEPFAALDAQTRETMQEYLGRIWFGQEKAALLVTHQVDEAVFLADRVVVLSARPGHVIADVPVTFSRPRDLGIKRSPEFQRLEEEIWMCLESTVGTSEAKAT